MKSSGGFSVFRSVVIRDSYIVRLLKWYMMLNDFYWFEGEYGKGVKSFLFKNYLCKVLYKLFLFLKYNCLMVNRILDDIFKSK